MVIIVYLWVFQEKSDYRESSIAVKVHGRIKDSPTYPSAYRMTGTAMLKPPAG